MIILIAIMLISISCTIMNEGIVFTDDEESNRIATGTAIAELIENLTSGATPEPDAEPVATAEPISQVGSSAPLDTSKISGDPVEYEVSGTNNGCICSVGGNMMINLDIQDDKLFFNLPEGTSYEFANVGPNTYKRSYMGYYILVDSETGEETRVDEEQHSVIILTEDGFVCEYYKGTEGSPCCFHTYTRAGNTP
jgi:hypothetical protein